MSFINWYISLFSYLPYWQQVTAYMVLGISLFVYFTSFYENQRVGSKLNHTVFLILFLLLYPMFAVGIYRFPGFQRLENTCFGTYTIIALGLFLFMTYTPINKRW